MRACIHRGANEIGGSCIELEARGSRLVLDAGAPLDGSGDTMPLHPVPGFGAPDPRLLGVVLTHGHLDHCGLVRRLPPGTQLLAGQATADVLAAAGLFTGSRIGLEGATALADRRTVRLGPFSVTPFLVDHSAYDAHALLVEADGARLFYTGDLRGHGRKATLFERLIADPPARVNVLVMEGTTVGRADAEAGLPGEGELEERMLRSFRATLGLAMVCCSGQNIDRLVTVYRAARRAGRGLVLDMYAAHVLRATGNPRLPQAGWRGVRVYLPHSQRKAIIARRAFEVSALYRRRRISRSRLRASAASSVMLIRPSMAGDLERADCLDGARLVYSMWSGYLRDATMRGFVTWLEGRGVPLEVCHTSGHASLPDLRRLREAFRGAVLVPIHSERGDRFEELFGNVRHRRDGEWWEVGDAQAREGEA